LSAQAGQRGGGKYSERRRRGETLPEEDESAWAEGEKEKGYISIVANRSMQGKTSNRKETIGILARASKRGGGRRNRCLKKRGKNCVDEARTNCGRVNHEVQNIRFKDPYPQGGEKPSSGTASVSGIQRGIPGGKRKKRRRREDRERNATDRRERRIGGGWVHHQERRGLEKKRKGCGTQEIKNNPTCVNETGKPGLLCKEDESKKRSCGWCDSMN